MSDKGTGVTVAFDSYITTIRNASWSGISREVEDVSTTATTGGKDFEVSDLYDPGELSAQILFDPDDVPDILVSGARTPISTVVTWSDAAGTTWTANAFMTALAPSFGDLDTRVVCDVTLKFSGDVAIV